MRNRQSEWLNTRLSKFEKDMSDFDYMVECLERDMVVMLVEKRGMNMSQALDAFYNSETYEKLRDVRSGLFSKVRGMYTIFSTMR